MSRVAASRHARIGEYGFDSPRRADERRRPRQIGLRQLKALDERLGVGFDRRDRIRQAEQVADAFALPQSQFGKAGLRDLDPLEESARRPRQRIGEGQRQPRETRRWGAALAASAQALAQSRLGQRPRC
ncbi:MAG: hypothetical protein E6H65_08165 [Betaproteobacteria bacterium]|nr:MAG: hypothetical protein E6H65_08165 [Betaproteobacteria bacterium]